MIHKFLVLLRVQHLQESAGRVSLERHANLVDLVQHDHRICRFYPFQALYDFTGHSSNIRPAVTLDLRLIPHPSDRKSEKLAIQCRSDGFANGGLPDPGRAYQADDGSADPAPLDDGAQILQDAVFDVLQSIMVPIQNAPGLFDVNTVLGVNSPGQIGYQ